MCETSRAVYQPLVGGYTVQRTWSTCRPPPVTIRACRCWRRRTSRPRPNLQDITIDGHGTPITRHPDPARDVEDGRGRPLQRRARGGLHGRGVDVASKFQTSTPELSFALDKTTGHNGDKLQLTITRVAKASNFGISELELQTQVNGASTGLWFALVTE